MPSITESLFDFDLGERVVGITDYCIHPAEPLRGVARLGGTKNPRLADIIALQPDLVIANQEENTQAAVEGLRAAGLRVLVHFPRTVSQAVADLAELAVEFDSPAGQTQVADLRAQLAACGADPLPARRVFVPIWQELQASTPWWMSFNAETFSHDILRLAGFANVFANRARRYPLAADLGQGAARPAEGRDMRYPRLTQAEIVAAQPEVILLPNEPYAYSQADVPFFKEAFAGTPAAAADQIFLVDGSLLTWPGTRIALALQGLRRLRATLA